MRKLTSVAVVAFLVGLLVAGPVAQSNFWGTGNDTPANFGADGKTYLSIGSTGTISAANSAVLSGFTITGATLTNPIVTGLTPVTVTGSTLTVAAATHAGRLVALNRAGGIAVTLPAATGTGNCYTFVVQATFTGDATIATAGAADYMIGTAVLMADGGDTVVGFATANTGTVATESDVLDLFDTGNVTGGIKGARAVLCDTAAAIWTVQYQSDAANSEATPFKVS